MAGLLNRIGKGLVSFGTGIPQINLDQQQAQIEGQNINNQLGQQQVDSNNAQSERNININKAASVAFGNGPNAIAAQRFLAINAPEIFDNINKQAGLETDRQKAEAADFAFKLENTPFDQRPQLIAERISNLANERRDFAATASLMGLDQESQDFSLRATQLSALNPEDRIKLIEDKGNNPGFTLSPGQTRFDSQGQEIASVAPDAQAASLKADERIDKQTEQKLKTEAGLRKEVNTLLKDFFQVSRANERMQAAGNNPTAAGDLALIFNYMKMLDPGSTVREGEFANAANSAGIPQRVVGVYNKLVSGKRLSDDQRVDFLNRGSSLFAAAQDDAVKTANNFEQIAKNAGVDVQSVIGEFQQRSAPSDKPVINASPKAIEFLRKNDTPENRKQFIEKFGGLPDGF